jgi:hypothetical protein
MSQYIHRRLDVAFTLGKGAFGDDGTQNTITMSGLRVSANVTKAGGTGATMAQIRIYGMTLQDMNKLSTLGKPVTQDRRNVVAVSAGVAGGGMALVFAGNINQAWADLNAAPQAAFIVLAVDGGLLATMPLSANTWKGSIDVATIMASLANQMGLTLENNGVSVILDNPYLWGSARDQVQSVAEQAGINYIIENVGTGSARGTLAIWPKNKTRGGSAVLVSKDSGMVGYPTFTQNGMAFKVLYNPTIIFGSQIKVESEIETANGYWTPISIDHDLESETPGGQWFTTIQANAVDHVTGITH